MRLKLYGDIGSGAAAVELALAEAGADYELINVDLGTDQQRESDYQRLNPQRKVPAIVDAEGHVVTESVAILLTVEERYPQARLLPPRASNERAQALRWLAFVATELYPIVEINDYPQRFATGDEQAAEATRSIAKNIWRERWLIVESAVAGNPYALPSGFCLTDLYIAVVSRWAQQESWRPKNLPKVERLCRAVAERPALRAVWGKHFG